MTYGHELISGHFPQHSAYMPPNSKSNETLEKRCETERFASRQVSYVGSEATIVEGKVVCYLRREAKS